MRYERGSTHDFWCEGSTVTCLHCGEDVLSMEYTLRCTPPTRAPREVSLFLCTDCLRELCTDPDIELVDDSPAASAD